MNCKSLKILLVEDNEDDYVVVKTLLTRIQEVHFDLVWATTYEQAIAHLSAPPSASGHELFPFDACLMDYHLGERNGLEILQEAISNQAQLPIILLTGGSSRDIDLKALELGASGFLAKDEITSNSLERTIRYAIRQKQSEVYLQQTQTALTQTNAGLESKVEEQSIELEQTRQREAHLRHLQTRLIPAVAHEFRTPLMNIQLSAELLEDHPSPNENTQSRRFQQIYDGVDRIAQNLDSALMYAGLEDGSIELEPSPVNLSIACERLISRFEKDSTNQQFIFSNPNQSADRILVDLKIIELVVTQLVLNAIRFTLENAVIQLQLNCESTPTGTRVITIKVQDNGIGIPSNELSKVFDAYYQASNANLIPGTPGIGIGLAIAKRAAQLHNGDIQLISEVGVGTTAIFSFSCESSQVAVLVSVV